jgi:hypothetical protein
MNELGFQASALHPAVCFHQMRDLRVVVHVDDFLCTDSEVNLNWLYAKLGEKYKLKRTMIIGHLQDAQEGTFLGRVIRWKSDGISLEWGPKHVGILLQ